eukprot:SM000070S21376  [mRNA]  locus=s70:596243:596608:- [translate_table: standard]
MGGASRREAIARVVIAFGAAALVPLTVAPFVELATVLLLQRREARLAADAAGEPRTAQILRCYCVVVCSAEPAMGTSTGFQTWPCPAMLRGMGSIVVAALLRASVRGTALAARTACRWPLQ